MFRTRPKDNLFGDTLDTLEMDEELESATVIPPPQQSSQQSPASSQPAAPQSNYSPASANSQPSQQPIQQQAPRPAETRQPPAQAAGSFRPATAAMSPSDLQRNRMPEVKPVSVPPASVAAQQPPQHFERPSDRNGDRMTKPNQRVLTVGHDILLKGEIATCDRLVIEGKVDATLNDVHTVEITQTGSFKGNAHVEEAEISGLFEGELVVSGRLVIYSTGKVRGKITYGEIEIERGGELTGEIKTITQQPLSNARNKKDEKVAA